MIVPGIIFLLWAMSADAGFSWLIVFSLFTSGVASTISSYLLEKLLHKKR